MTTDVHFILIESIFIANRPHLSQSSLKTYTSVLYNLHKHMTDGANHTNIEWYKTNSSKIIIHLKDNVKKATRKSILSALYVLTKIHNIRNK